MEWTPAFLQSKSGLASWDIFSSLTLPRADHKTTSVRFFPVTVVVDEAACIELCTSQMCPTFPNGGVAWFDGAFLRLGLLRWEVLR
jgi:hypothetical protein